LLVGKVCGHSSRSLLAIHITALSLSRSALM
jgi:hypothetical protein